MTAGLVRSTSCTSGSGTRWSARACCSRRRSARRQAANAALAEVLVDEPYRRTWHRAQSISGQDDDVADELEEPATPSRCGAARPPRRSGPWSGPRSSPRTRPGAAAGCCWPPSTRSASAAPTWSTSCSPGPPRTSLSRLDQARMEWLREIFNDGVPGDAGRVLELCDIAAEAVAAGDADLALNLLLGAALRCWWADTGPAARGAGRRGGRPARPGTRSDDPRYVAALARRRAGAAGRRRSSSCSTRVVIETVTDPAALWLLGMAAHAVGDPVRAVDFLGRAETRLREQGRLGAAVPGARRCRSSTGWSSATGTGRQLPRPRRAAAGAGDRPADLGHGIAGR